MQEEKIKTLYLEFKTSVKGSKNLTIEFKPRRQKQLIKLLEDNLK